MEKIKRYVLCVDPASRLDVVAVVATEETEYGPWVKYDDVAQYLPENQMAATQAKIDLKADEAQARVVLMYLCEVTGRKYRPTIGNLKLILARIREGYSVQDCKAVIDLKQKSDFFVERGLVNPVSLFRVSNFDRYLQEACPPQANRVGNPPMWAQQKIADLREKIQVILNGIRGLPYTSPSVEDARAQVATLEQAIKNLEEKR